MTNPTIISKYLHVVVMGKKDWHEEVALRLKCTCGMRFGCTRDMDRHLSLNQNPDYLNNKSDWVDFLDFFLNEWNRREDFLRDRGLSCDDGHGEYFILDIALLAKRTTLPTSVYDWSKEEEDG